MSYKIITHVTFEKEFKRLAKKYRSLKNDYIVLLNELQSNPTTGTLIAPGIRKVRMAIASKGKGKSHGARIITHFIDSFQSEGNEVSIFANIEEGTIVLLTIYDKAERGGVSKSLFRPRLPIPVILRLKAEGSPIDTRRPLGEEILRLAASE